MVDDGLTNLFTSSLFTVDALLQSEAATFTTLHPPTPTPPPPHMYTHLRPLYSPIHVPDRARVPLPQSEKCQPFSLLSPPIPASLRADKGHE